MDDSQGDQLPVSSYAVFCQSENHIYEPYGLFPNRFFFENEYWSFLSLFELIFSNLPCGLLYCWSIQSSLFCLSLLLFPWLDISLFEFLLLSRLKVPFFVANQMCSYSTLDYLALYVPILLEWSVWTVGLTFFEIPCASQKLLASLIKVSNVVGFCTIG